MAIRDLRVDGQPENKTGIERLRVGVLGMGSVSYTHLTLPTICSA